MKKKENNKINKKKKEKEEKYFGNPNYIGTTCSLEEKIYFEKDFITQDNKYRINIRKLKVKDSNQIYLCICTIYDNNFKLCRDFNPNIPNYKGQLFSFEFRESLSVEYFKSELSLFIYFLKVMINTQETQYMVLQRRLYQYDYNNYLFEFKQLPPQKVISKNNPIYFNKYYNINISIFKSNKSIDLYNPKIYKNKPKLNKINIIFNQGEIIDFINILIYIYNINEFNAKE